MADLVTIKKIRTAAGDHLIDATYLGGHTFEQIESMVHGGVETYVIPSSKSSISGYTTIVESTESTLTTTKTVLDSLTDGQENGGYKLGDVILMEATSDGEKVFDRWVSKVDGENITLAVLETQVAKHHHTVGVTTSKAKALTSATPTPTTNAIPTIGSAVTVLTGTSGDVITSVDHDDKGGHNLAIVTTTSIDGVGHSHTVNSHSHTVTFTPSTLVSQNVDVYTSLTSANHTPHTHTTTTVAGAHVDGSKITYATGEGSTDTFIKTLTDSSSNTNTGSNTKGLTTDVNTNGLTTSTQASTDAVGSVVLTVSNGAHTHTVTTTTTENVITDVSLASNVVTSVKYTLPTLADNVVTSVTTTSHKVITSWKDAPASSFLNDWYCDVDSSGVLSFTIASSNAVTSATIVTSSADVNVVSSVTSTTQSVGSWTVTSATQTYTSGKVDASGNADEAGSHQHGFSHTHVIPSHTHDVASHTHTYVKTVASTTGSAYTSLTTSSHIPHTHTNADVASTAADGSPFKYITGGSTTPVVRNLTDVEQSYTSTTSSPVTDTKYYKLSGDITFPGLTLGKKTLSTTTVTPAVEGSEKPIKSITYEYSSDFVTSVTVDDDGKTSTNIGGE